MQAAITLPPLPFPEDAGDLAERTRAADIAQHGGVFAKALYAVEQLVQAVWVPADRKPTVLMRLALLLEVPGEHEQAEVFHHSPDGQALLRDRPVMTAAHLDRLLQLPPDTLGGALGRFAQQRDLKPFALASPTSLPDDQAYTFWRRQQTHDVRHVVTGYDNTLAGEAALLCFAAAQTPTRFMRLCAVLTSLVVLLRDPRELPTLRDAWRRGQAADNLAPVYWEWMWTWPLDSVRGYLGVPSLAPEP